MKNQTDKSGGGMLWSIPTFAFLVLIGALFSSDAARGADLQPTPAPPEPGHRPESSQAPSPNAASAAPGYCPSIGGSTSYEYVSSVNLVPNPGGTMRLSVQVYIANPTGCTAGEPCPEYDSSPENVNVWIDWNGDKTWDAWERVMDAALTGYLSINYRGTMTAVTQFTPPDPASITDEPTWMRANLGWSHDPNDPCEYSWSWGNVVDQEVHPEGAEIESISAKGVGTPGENPQTGDVVRLEAEIDVPAGYEITRCSWTGDLTPGNGDTANKCRYEYTPATGAGPAVNTYGEKDITLTLTYRHIASGATGQTSKNHSPKVFFKKGAAAAWADDDGDGEPNWFEYWADDGAVAGLSAADVEYDQTLGNNTYGYWSPADDNVHIGGAAARTHYPGGLNVPASAGSCPGGDFGDVSGTDSATEVLVHERRHETIVHNWQAGGPWVGQTDSDEGVPTAAHDDDLPDTYENTAGTRNDNVDSCDLATHKSATYDTYGDNEFDAMNTSDGSTGVAANDWANPGKQSTPPFILLAPETQQDMLAYNSRSGAASALAPYKQTLHVSDAVAGSLIGSYTDEGVDSDGDGDYNSLRLTVDVNVTTASMYNVVAWLEDGSSTPIAWASTQQSLAAGPHTVELSFDGPIIRDSGLNGPYTIARVELREGDEEGLVDFADNAHTTSAYQASDFDARVVEFAGSYGDIGVDTGSDGLYDLLRINVDLNAEAADTYTVVGELEGAQDIAVASTTAALSPAIQTIALNFDGKTIFQHRENGPYHLRALRVEDSLGNRIHFVAEAYVTGGYSYNQFQHGATTIDGSAYTDQALDVDGDGDFDYLRVDVSINVDTAGTYHLTTVLKDSGGMSISEVLRSVEATAGVNVASMDFAGGDIYAHGVDGPYQVASVSLLDGEGNIVDYHPMAHTTQTYSYGDFSMPLVALGSIQDYGEDTDGDGRYNNLTISIQVTPGDAGVIVAQARLTDSTGDDIGWAENFAEMEAGLAQAITLTFTYGQIVAHGEDGPYQLRNLALYHTGDPEQAISVENAHTTAAYELSDFDALNAIYLPIIVR